MRARTVCGVLVMVVTTAACSEDAAKRRHLDNGNEYLRSGQVPQAIIEFRNAVDRDDVWGEARYLLAEAYAANGEPERALREYVRAADLLPDDTTAQIKAATYLLVAGQFEDARTRIQRLIEREPQNAEAEILLGNALAGLRDLDGAIQQIMEAIELDPNRSQSYANLAMLKLAQGRRGEALAAFEKAVYTDQKSVRARLALANFLWSIGDVEATAKSLKIAYSLDSKDVITNRALAVYYIATGQAPAAEAHLQFVAAQTKAPVAQLALADYYIAIGRRDDARVVLEQLAANRSASAAAATRLAGLAYTAGQTSEAYKRIDDLLEKEPSFAPAHLLKARWLLSEGKRELALEAATAAVAANPRSAVALYVRGLAESASHRSNEAIKSFTEVLRHNPRAALAQVHLSRLHLERNSVDTAVLFAEEALASAPNSLDAHLVLIRAWVARGDHGRAQQALAALKKRAPDVAGVHSLDGSLQLIVGNRPAAREAFIRALQIDARSIEALTGITTLDVAQGDVPLAVGRIDAVLSTGTEDPDVLYLAGKVFTAAEQYERAERTLRRACDLDPLNVETFALLGRLYLKQNRLEAALAELDTLVKSEPRNAAARLMAAMIVHGQGDLGEAQKRYHQVLELEPRSVLAANNLAAIYSDQGENLDIAEQLAEKAADQMPGHPEIQDTLGMIYYKRHQVGAAVRRLEQSVAIAPENAVYNYHLGLAYAKSGDKDRAQRALEAALKLEPSYAEAKQALSVLRAPVGLQ